MDRAGSSFPTLHDALRSNLERLSTTALRADSRAPFAPLEDLQRQWGEGRSAHGGRVAEVAQAIGRALQLAPFEMRRLTIGCRLHDVGKVLLPGGLLEVAGPLDEAQWLEIRQHPLLGAALVQLVPSSDTPAVTAIVRHHHERSDGSGYPDGLRGNEITRLTMIAAISDTYVAMRESRPYRIGFSHDQACHRILNGDDKSDPQQFEPSALAAFQTVSAEIAAHAARWGQEAAAAAMLRPRSRATLSIA